MLDRGDETAADLVLQALAFAQTPLIHEGAESRPEYIGEAAAGRGRQTMQQNARRLVGSQYAANQAARILLHGLPTTPGRSFTDIFRTRFSSFMDEGRLRERQRLQDEVGSSFIATIEHPNVSPMLRAVTKPRVSAPA